MNRYFSFRRMVLAIAALGLCGLVGPLPASQAGPYQASGTFKNTGTHGNIVEGVVSGQSSPGGRFTGGFRQKATAGGIRVEGVGTLVYGGGALSIAYSLRFDAATQRYFGTWVVTGGTGNLTGASGGGSMITTRGAAGTFALSGNLNR